MIVTSDYELEKVVAPNLPLAPTLYDPRYQEQFNNVLRLYFNRLNSILGQLNTSLSSTLLPFGSFSSNVTQSTTANTATLMTLNTTDFSNQISIISSKFTVVNAGIYNLQFSTQFQNTDTQLHDVSIWVRQNGVDLAGSNGLISVPSSHGGTPGHIIAGWNYLISMAASDYVELYWSTDNTAVTAQFYAAGVTPTRPTTASVIATMTFVSALNN